MLQGQLEGSSIENGHMYGTDDIIDADGNLTGQFSGRTVGGIVRVADNASLVSQRADSALSGQSEHTVLMGLAGEENARVAMDADGVVMHGPGGDSGGGVLRGHRKRSGFLSSPGFVPPQ